MNTPKDDTLSNYNLKASYILDAKKTHLLIWQNNPKLKGMLSHERVSVNDENWLWAVSMIPCVGRNILINFIHVRKYILCYILLIWKNIPWHKRIFFHITKVPTWPSHVAFSSPKHHVEGVHAWFLMGFMKDL
jgi:hypothetical protein